MQVFFCGLTRGTFYQVLHNSMHDHQANNWLSWRCIVVAHSGMPVTVVVGNQFIMADHAYHNLQECTTRNDQHKDNNKVSQAEMLPLIKPLLISWLQTKLVSAIQPKVWLHV